MEFTALKELQNSVHRLETAMTRRENVIRFLVGRLLIMLAMVIGFGVSMLNRF